MTEITRSALLPYDAHDIYHLVNDIEAYPRYMDGCVGARILSSDESSVVARLELARAGFRQSFVTRNVIEPGRRIVMELVEGPFEHFEGVWCFHALGGTACRVTLDLRFTLAGGLFGAAARRMFQSVGNNLVDALCKRANDVYGTG